MLVLAVGGWVVPRTFFGHVVVQLASLKDFKQNEIPKLDRVWQKCRMRMTIWVEILNISCWCAITVLDKVLALFEVEQELCILLYVDH